MSVLVPVVRVLSCARGLPGILFTAHLQYVQQICTTVL